MNGGKEKLESSYSANSVVRPRLLSIFLSKRKKNPGSTLLLQKGLVATYPRPSSDRAVKKKVATQCLNERGRRRTLFGPYGRTYH